MNAPIRLVDPDLCRADGICTEICPEHVLTIVDGRVTTDTERADHCILCGQCVAVCPTGALRMPALREDRFDDLGKQPVDYDAFLSLLRHRRSVRVFKDRPVERRLIEQILDAAATAPIGMPPHSTAVVIIDRKEERELLLAELVNDYDAMLKGLSTRLGRALARLSMSAGIYRALVTHVADAARFANALYRERGIDRYMYHAPAVLLFHGSRRDLAYEENAHLVCAHAMLAALSLGVGSTVIGMIPPIVERSKLLRERYGIPADHEVITSLILGYPKYRYRRSIRRELAGVRYV